MTTELISKELNKDTVCVFCEKSGWTYTFKVENSIRKMLCCPTCGEYKGVYLRSENPYRFYPYRL